MLSTVFLLATLSVNTRIKTEAVKLPINFTGILPTEELVILQSNVINELSTYYDLKSEKGIEQTRETAVDKKSQETAQKKPASKSFGGFLLWIILFLLSLGA